MGDGGWKVQTSGYKVSKSRGVMQGVVTGGLEYLEVAKGALECSPHKRNDVYLREGMDGSKTLWSSSCDVFIEPTVMLFP